MLLSELYNMEDAYKCKNNEDALRLFEKLQKDIGTVYQIYKKIGVISGRQHATHANAMYNILEDNYVKAIQETYDFLENYGENEHELTNPEYMMLDSILTLIAYKHGIWDLINKQKIGIRGC